MVDTGLKGKVAFVTGANHGIGAAAAVALAREGADIFLTYKRLSPEKYGAKGPRAGDGASKPGPGRYYEILARDAEDVVRSIHALGGRCHAREADLSDPGNVPRLMDDAERAFGKVDILVNNAAHDRPDSFLPAGELPASGLFGGEYSLRTISAASHDEHFAVNCRAAALLMAEFARRHVARKSSWGRIISISTDGASGHGWNVSYGASKYAGESHARAAAVELGPYGITVNVVSPGAVQTGWLPEDEAEALAKRYPLRRIGTPDDIAAAVVFFASRQADWITGQVLYVGGGNRM
ncbi:MAG: SDR family oxidoreductase [Candidatus Aminicenantes bacterium]|nr:SDR family oxidoreductase [Candidatus Aminicenantes bacterium]